MTNQTTVVLDFSVCVHRLHETLEGVTISKEDYASVVKASMVWLQSCEWLGSLVEDMDAVQTISVLDTKIAGGYWRTEYLKQPEVYQNIPAKKATKKNPAKMMTEPVAYKGGRKFPDHSFTKLKHTMTSITEERGYNMLAMPGYEADDLAAAVVMINSMREDPHNIILATVDADWMGMISDQVTWFCTTGYTPRVRHSMEQVNSWAERRLGKTLLEPSDIWAVKAVQGDKSDNLPPGSPIEVIDLFNPPEEHKLWNNAHVWSQVYQMLDQPQQASSYRVKDAQNFLCSRGVPRFITPFVG